MDIKSGVIKFRFYLIQVSYWCTIASFFAFFVVFMRGKGTSAGTIGAIIAIYRLSSIGGQVFWGNICDKYQTNKKVFILTNVLLYLFTMVVFTAANSIQLFLGAALLGFCQNPTLTNMDTWLLKYYKGSQAVYGPALAAGSLTYGIFVFFYGKLIATHGYGIMPYFMGIFVLASIINAVFTPDALADDSARKSAMNKEDIKFLFKNSEFVFLLTILFFIGFTMISMGQIKPMMWEHMQAGVVYQGYDASAAMALQTPMFLMASRLSSIAPRKRLCAAVILYLISISFALVAPVPQLVVSATLIAGMGYGILLPALREIVRKIAPEKMATTAQGLADAVFGSVSGVTGALLAGVAIDFIGFKAFIMILWCMLILLLIFVLYKNKKQTAAD